MHRVNELAKLARTLEKQTADCKRCGICQAACPLFSHTRLEKDIARGKIAVLEGVMAETVKNAHQALKVLDRCLLCGRCAGVCPSGIDTLHLFINARVVLTGYIGLSPVKKIIFRQILTRPRLFDKITWLAARGQPLFFKKTRQTPDVRLPRTTSSLLLSKRHLTPLAPISFHRQTKTALPPATHTDTATNTPGDKNSSTVLFFTGCLIDKLFPHVAQASVRALRYHNATPILLKNEVCCGIPALSSGDETAFRQLMRQNLDQLDGLQFDRLVTACATCAFTLKNLWPLMTPENDDRYSTVQELSRKTMDISEFIAANAPPETPLKKPHPIPVTYHDPCHLKQSLGISQEPRALIDRTSNYQLTEMTGADTCCGMGGGFGLAHYDLSRKIGQSKAEAIRQTGCRIVATSCPACMIQLIGILSQAGQTGIQVKHAIELYVNDK